MHPTPLWKLKRELRRALGQIAAAPAALLMFLAARPYYDFVLARQKRTVAGTVPFGPKIAVYLIFPKIGLLASHMRAIAYLRSHDYAPVIVSNHPLDPADRDKLIPHASVIIERPNFGYDFGGYRDGVLALADRLPGLDRLVLMNDSCWFPLPGCSDWLADAEALGVDLGAATWTGAVDRPAPWEFEKIEWKVDKGRRNFHYASYALSLSASILRDPEFLTFWQHFRLTQQKNRTVRRGEIGLTAWVLGRGYSHGATHELADLAKRLEALPRDGLIALLRDLIVLDDPEMEEIHARLLRQAETGEVERRRIEQVILAVAARRGVAYALADMLVRELKFPFLKKSPVRQAGAAARTLAVLANDMRGPIGVEIAEEIRRGS